MPKGWQQANALQARHDSALAQTEQDKAATAASTMAQEAVQETQDVQALTKLCTPPQTVAKSAPTVANTATVKASPPDAFAPSGPARPLGASPDPF